MSKSKVAKGTYVLVLHLSESVRVAVGKLGVISFPAGYHVYAGSALGGLEHRLSRHLRTGKVPRWHVDYLREFATVAEVWFSISHEDLECRWAKVLGSLPEAATVAPSFGSSDCRCRSHLIHFSQLPDLSSLGATRWRVPDTCFTTLAGKRWLESGFGDRG